MLALRVPGLTPVFVLQAGKQFEAFQKAAAPGKQFRITGQMHGSHEDAPPGLTAEKYE